MHSTLIAFATLASSAFAQQLITNGGFQSGPSPWSFTNVGYNPNGHANDPDAHAYLTGTSGTLSQNTRAVAGMQYTISFQALCSAGAVCATTARLNAAFGNNALNNVALTPNLKTYSFVATARGNDILSFTGYDYNVCL